MKKKIIIGLLVAAIGVVAYWTTGRMDPALSSLGLNYTDCASNGFGATLCGDDLKRYERAVKGSDNKGADVEAKSTAVTAAEAMETCATDNDGSYAGCTRAELESIEPTLTDARLDVDAKTASYDIVVTSARSDDVVFVLQRLSDGTPRRTCDTGSEPNGGCPTDGWW